MLYAITLCILGKANIHFLFYIEIAHMSMRSEIMNILRKIVLVIMILVAATKMIHCMIIKTIHTHELEEIHAESHHEITDRRSKILAV